MTNFMNNKELILRFPIMICDKLNPSSLAAPPWLANPSLCPDSRYHYKSFQINPISPEYGWKRKYHALINIGEKRD